MWVTCHYLLAYSKHTRVLLLNVMCCPWMEVRVHRPLRHRLGPFISLWTGSQSKLTVAHWACGSNLYHCHSCLLPLVSHFFPLTKTIAAEGAHPLSVSDCKSWKPGAQFWHLTCMHGMSTVACHPLGHHRLFATRLPDWQRLCFKKREILHVTLLNLSSNTEWGQDSKFAVKYVCIYSIATFVVSHQLHLGGHTGVHLCGIIKCKQVLV